MTDDRARVLADIRRALGRERPTPEALAEVQRTIDRPTRLVPARGQGSHESLVDRFVTMAEEAAATVTRIEGYRDVPDAIRAFLENNGADGEVLVAPHPCFTELDWQGAGIRVRSGLPEPDEQVVVTGAFAAAAETGTLVVCSGPEHPSSLNLLPDNHIVVLPESRVLGSYEDTWDLLRAEYPGGLPRTVLWITGPSRTGDIEQTLYLGAHGPRRLHILLLSCC